MSDPQRTHPATPKRVREFRKRGEIALSRDLVSTTTLAGGTIGLIMGASSASAALMELTRAAVDSADGRTLTTMPGIALRAFMVAVTPVMLGAATGALVAILGQLGWPPAFKGLEFNPGRMNPMANLPETFGLSGMARRTGAAIAKVVVVGLIVGGVALRGALTSEALEAGSIAALAWSVTVRALWTVLGALVVLAAIDYYLARRRMGERMKMSPDEVKREHKEQDGDPMVKGRRRQRMRELAKRRMAAAVAGADVIVVNPTHYAVALRYQDGKDRAPVVVAKGVDEQAEKIREIARQHGVPVLARPPLARALYKVKEGHPVPGALFRAVAEVLAYVYRLRRGNA